MAHLVTALGVPRVRPRLPGLVVRELVAPGAFVIAALASSYAISALPGVKLIDLLVFAAAYCLGPRRGATVAVAAWAVYANFNPWGPTHLLLASTQIIAAMAYVTAGVVVRRLMAPSAVPLGPGRATLLLAAAALMATATFDVLTNLYTGYYWSTAVGGSDLGRWLWTGVANPGALFFMAVHVSANVLFFATFGPLLIRGADQARWRWGW